MICALNVESWNLPPDTSDGEVLSYRRKFFAMPYDAFSRLHRHGFSGVVLYSNHCIIVQRQGQYRIVITIRMVHYVKEALAKDRSPLVRLLT
jgi:hypothetical protein